MKSDYTVKGNLANMLKFRLDSTKWTPSNPRCLGFEASIDTCSDPEATKIGSRPIIYDLMWEREGRTLIGSWDSLRFDKPAVITGIAKLDPSFDATEVGKTEGIEFSEPEIAEVRRTEAAERLEIIDRAKELIDRSREILANPEVREAVMEMAGEEMEKAGFGKIPAIRPSCLPPIPFYYEAHGRANAIKDLLEVAAMPNASEHVKGFCLAAADLIATRELPPDKE